jgi:ATP-dependent helicase/nuclease subunit A
VPRGPADVPRPYIAQLALYRALLGRLYPEKTIRAALLFTAGPILVELPGAAMEAELGQIMRQNTAG